MRKYGNYPSVTSVISEIYTSKNQFLQNWLKDPDNRASVEKSTAFGTEIHNLTESYLKKLSFTIVPNSHSQAQDCFLKHIKPFCDEIYHNVVLIEKKIISDKFAIGGTVDIFLDNGLVVDLKTSSKLKHRNSLEGYKMQLGAYAAMIKENYPEYPITGGLLLIVILSEDKVQKVEITKDELLTYFKKFMMYRSEFYKLHNY